MSEKNKMVQTVTEMMEHFCEYLCVHPRRVKLSQEELDIICDSCKMGDYVDDVMKEYNRLNDFDKSQCKALMEKYQRYVRCNECEYQAFEKVAGTCWCRSTGGLNGELEDWDGCTRGKRKEEDKP